MKVMSINVKGLNNPNKVKKIKDLCVSIRPNLIENQEFKVQNLDDKLVSKFQLSGEFEFAQLPATGTN